MSAECAEMAAFTGSIHEGEMLVVVKLTISSTVCCRSTKCLQGDGLDTWFLNGKKDKWPPARNFCGVTKQKVSGYEICFQPYYSMTVPVCIPCDRLESEGRSLQVSSYFHTHLNTLSVTAVFLGHSRRLRLASLMNKCKMWLHKQAEKFCWWWGIQVLLKCGGHALK